jgi:tetratricopeptide (TPR) repeat protein
MAAKKAENPELKKAQDLHKQAQKYAAKTLLHSPEWDRAATAYRDALKAYMKADVRDGPVLVACLKESAQAHKNSTSLHQAAQDLQKAAELLSKDQKDEKAAKESAQLYKEAGNIYRANEALEKSAQCYISAANGLEKDVDEAINCINEACKVFEEAMGKNQFSEPTFDKCIAFCVKVERWKDVIGLMKRKCLMYQEHLDTFEQYLYKTYLAMMVVYFLREDYKTAADDFKQWEAVAKFQDSEIWGLCGEMLQAYENGSPEELKKCIDHSQMKFLPNSVARLVKKIKFRDDVVQAQKAQKDGVDKKDAGEVDLT